MMNIVQLHDRVRFWIDTVSSTRFESDDIDLAINSATKEVVDEKYDHSRLNHNSDAFQKTQRIRDELSNLAKKVTESTITMTQYTERIVLETSTFPSDYKYLLALLISDGSGNRYIPEPLSYNEKNVIRKNPFRRIKSGIFPKIYYLESNLGIEIYHPFNDSTLVHVTMDYLADPVDVFYGYEKTSADSLGLNTPFITTLSPTSYKSVEYVSGTALATDGVTQILDYGLAVIDFVNPDINGFLHEEIAKRAAAGCLLTAGDYEKYKTLKAETLAT